MNRSRSSLRLRMVRWLVALTIPQAAACDLCAIYRAAGSRGDYSTGFTLTLAEQYTPYGTEQFNGEELHREHPDFYERAKTHLVGGWNFAERGGVSVNLPIIYQSYRFNHLMDGVTPQHLEGSEVGIGDLAVVGRWRAWEKSSREWGFTANLLGGVKLPTGDTEHLEELEHDIENYEHIVGPGHSHDVLGTSVSGVHLHDLTLGSGSVDGIFGITGSARWRRTFFNAQAQYYLRTEGAADYRFADELIISGGPGAFLWLTTRGTLSLSLNTIYETRGPDEFRGQPSDQTGLTIWYVGPQAAFTWKSHFSAQLGVDWAVHAVARGFQNTPDYRINATLTWRF